MNLRNYLFESNYKKLGHISFNENDFDLVNGDQFRASIKVMLFPEGYELAVDFNLYQLSKPSLFFINSNQYLNIIKGNSKVAQMLHYNRDFYCVQIHDAEVACDGLLFNNIFENPKVDTSETDAEIFEILFKHVLEEIKLKDHSSEEMIRTYLKQIIIRATRSWKKQNLVNEVKHLPNLELDLFRNFSRFVEIHFREKHSVADYAKMLNIAPKTLSNKFHKQGLESPNDMIKKRIVLETKRLLLYTDLSIKEISYQLGYDDPAYFNRLFTQKTKSSPAAFRKEIKG
nr:helix-turn-helix domain-containing protein [Pseudopedobacter sp.]